MCVVWCQERRSLGHVDLPMLEVIVCNLFSFLAMINVVSML